MAHTINLRIGRISRLFSPGFAWCHRCKTSWRFVDGHSTFYSEGHGCFPLCEKCWSDLKTGENRLPFYRQLWTEWNADAVRGHYKLRDPEAWDRISAAVLEGK